MPVLAQATEEEEGSKLTHLVVCFYEDLGKLQDRDCYNNGERGLILDGG